MDNELFCLCRKGIWFFYLNTGFCPPFAKQGCGNTWRHSQILILKLLNIAKAPETAFVQSRGLP